MRVIVCGSRGWTDRERIADRLADLSGDSIVLHGAAKGADRIAAQEAQKLGLVVVPYPAEWEKYGKRAGHLRNRLMAMTGADLCIAFWDGSSRGTSDMMEIAAEFAIPIDCQHRDFPNRERVAADFPETGPGTDDCPSLAGGGWGEAAE